VTDGTRAALRVPLAPNDNLGAVSTQAPCSRPPGEAARQCQRRLLLGVTVY